MRTSDLIANDGADLAAVAQLMNAFKSAGASQRLAEAHITFAEVTAKTTGLPLSLYAMSLMTFICHVERETGPELFASCARISATALAGLSLNNGSTRDALRLFEAFLSTFESNSPEDAEGIWKLIYEMTPRMFLALRHFEDRNPEPSTPRKICDCFEAVFNADLRQGEARLNWMLAPMRKASSALVSTP